jgi:predicted signal transduction protein with EAL and GGDEF domain
MAREQIRFLHSRQAPKKSGSTPSTTDLSYVVGAGKRLRLTRFSFGHESSTAECRIVLLKKIANTESTLSVGYGCGQFVIDEDVPTGEVIVRLINGDTGELHMTGVVEGVLI